MSKPDKQLPVPSDRRCAARRKSLFEGKMVYGQACEFTQDCAIRDITEYGARIEVPRGHIVPENFYLVDLKHQAAHDATIVWRHRCVAGVHFRQSFDLHDDPALFLRVLRQIWIHSVRH